MSGTGINGIGREFVRLVPVDAQGRMRVDLLAAEVERDRALGHLPAFVSATVGTTGVNAIDSVPEIADVCRANGLWLHVDAAMSGRGHWFGDVCHFNDDGVGVFVDVVANSLAIH